jgi:hypothetical protein
MRPKGVTNSRYRAVTCVWIAQLMLTLPLFAYASPIPTEVKKMVAFIYVPHPKTGQLVPNGTAFFIGVPGEGTLQKKTFRYLVTAKHVLTNGEGGSWYSSIIVRVNKVASGTDSVPVTLITEGPGKNVFTEADPTVDIAVVKMPARVSEDDINVFPISQITSKEDFPKLRVSEGTDIFFVGLFNYHTGEERNYPVVRFGHVALLSNEKVSWNGVMTDLYLVESGSYGGNSGAPVFLFYETARADGSSTIDLENLHLAGVMKGTFRDIQPVAEAEVDTSVKTFSFSSNGIAAVTPSYKLKEILYSSELVSQRTEGLSSK